MVEQKVSLRLRNSFATPITLLVEPWGNSYTMPADSAVVVVARGPQQVTNENLLEIEVCQDEIIIYGWGGSTVDVVTVSEE